MSLLKSILVFLGMKSLTIASLILSTIFVHSPILANDWFFIGGNRSPSNVGTPFRGIYTEINTDSFGTASIDGNKGIAYKIRVGAIFKDGRSGLASHNDDELIRDCVRNRTWHVKTQRWSSDWKELGDYLCDLSTRPSNKWGGEIFKIQTKLQ